jgi:hypothetical protein
MRWSPLLSVIIGLSVAVGRLLSQEASGDDASGVPQESLPSALRDSEAAHFRLILGRVELDPVRYRKISQRFSGRRNARGDRIDETLAIESCRGLPRLHYTRSGASTRMSLDVEQRGLIVMRADVPSESVRVTATQPQQGMIEVCWESGQQVREYRFDSWIHFCIAQPSLYRQSFATLLDDMLHPVSLEPLAEQAHRESLRRIAHEVELMRSNGGSSKGPAEVHRLDDPALQSLIGRLGSGKRNDRLAAQAELRRHGLALLPRLGRLDPTRLDAEQKARVDELRRQLTPRGEDCAARIAVLISDDREYWAAAESLLNDADRSLVAAHFNRQPQSQPSKTVRVAKNPGSDLRYR